MAIEAARLASGSISMNGASSANATVLAQIYTESEPDIRAVVKCLTPKQIANELIASSLTAALNLPSPRSFIVFADPKDSIGGVDYLHSNDMLMYFGSELSASSTLINFFKMNSQLAFQLVNNYQDWGRLLAFDEWTANADRHLNNYLYDGKTIYLFDHDRCLTGPNWAPSSLNAETLYPCHRRINEIHSHMPANAKSNAKSKSKELQKTASAIDVQVAVDLSLAAAVENNVPNDLPAATAFLKDRVGHISSLCDQRIR